MIGSNVRQGVVRIISTHQTGWGRSQGKMTYYLELECGHEQLRPESRPVKGKIVCIECSFVKHKEQLAQERLVKVEVGQ